MTGIQNSTSPTAPVVMCRIRKASNGHMEGRILGLGGTNRARRAVRTRDETTPAGYKHGSEKLYRERKLTLTGFPCRADTFQTPGFA
jgi:hypothetical protein